MKPDLVTRMIIVDVDFHYDKHRFLCYCRRASNQSAQVQSFSLEVMLPGEIGSLPPGPAAMLLRLDSDAKKCVITNHAWNAAEEI